MLQGTCSNEYHSRSEPCVLVVVGRRHQDVGKEGSGKNVLVTAAGAGKSHAPLAPTTTMGPPTVKRATVNRVAMPPPAP